MPTPSRALSMLLVTLTMAASCERGPATVSPAPDDSPQAECPGVERVASLWTPTRRAALEAALAPIPGEWPAQLITTIDAQAPALAQRWSSGYARACEAGAPERTRCLDAQVSSFDAALTLIAEDPERAAELWSVFERVAAAPDECGEAGGEGLTPARGRELASLPMLLALGEAERAAALLGELEADPTLAEAWQLALARAWIEQAAGHDDAAAAALARIDVEALDARARLAVADAWARLREHQADVAAAEQARAQAIELARELDDPWAVVAQLQALGDARIARGQPAEAAPPLVEAIAIATRVARPDNPRVAQLQTTLAEAQLALGQIEAAHDALTQARDAFVIALGPDHPHTLATVEAVGRLFVRAGQPGDAQFAFLDLLEVYTDLYGVKHWRTAKVKLELADSLMAMDQHESAQQLYTEALTPLAQQLGPVDPAVIRASIHLGIAELALGNLDAAQLDCSRGRDLAKALPPGNPLTDEAERCLAELGERSKARPKKTNKK